MTRVLRSLLFATILSAPAAGAVDLPLVEDTATGLTGAIGGVLGEDISTTQYLPGYGFHYTIRFRFGEDTSPDVLIERLRDVIVRLTPTVQGLEEGDWISVWAHGFPRSVWGNDASSFTILLRIQWDDPSNIEVWKDGELVN